MPSPESIKNFSELIRNCRTAKDMTQFELATAIDMSERWVTKIEAGDIPIRPKLAPLLKLAEVLDIPPGELLELLDLRMTPSILESDVLESCVRKITVSSPSWYEQFSKVAGALCDLSSGFENQSKLLAGARDSAVRHVLNQALEHLKQLGNQPVMAGPDVCEDQWHQIFGLAQTEIWMTNRSRSWTTGRSTDERYLTPQRKAAHREKNPVYIERVFVVRPEDKLNLEAQLFKVIRCQLAAGIHIRLVTLKTFNAVVEEHGGKLESSDFMIIDKSVTHFSALDAADKSVVRRWYSTAPTVLEAANRVREGLSEEGKSYPLESEKDFSRGIRFCKANA